MNLYVFCGDENQTVTSQRGRLQLAPKKENWANTWTNAFGFGICIGARSGIGRRGNRCGRRGAVAVFVVTRRGVLAAKLVVATLGVTCIDGSFVFVAVAVVRDNFLKSLNG